MFPEGKPLGAEVGGTDQREGPKATVTPWFWLFWASLWESEPDVGGVKGSTSTVSPIMGDVPTPQKVSPNASRLALQVARCPELVCAADDPSHACHPIVTLQGSATNPERQLPEAWAGGLETAKVAYLASNPAISDDEDFPRTRWSDEAIVSFVTRRFDQSQDHPWVRDHRYRRIDGSYSARQVRFWEQARKRTDELLGYTTDPSVDYVLTEVVHCKSKREIGVRSATPLCGSRYLDAIFRLCPAPLIVIVGSAARDAVSEILGMPERFGRRSASGRDNLLVRTLGGRERLVAYHPHFSGMEPNRSFTARYGSDGVENLRAIAFGNIAPNQMALPSPC